MATPKAVIFGCSGPRLTADERRFFAEANPFGLIVFARNIENPTQLTALTSEFRATVGREDAPVLIDQEGGRVVRLKPPHWDTLPPAASLGALYESDPVRGIAAAKLLGRLLAGQLAPLGITVNCTPDLDLNHAGADPATCGDRCFSSNVRTVATLGRAVCDGLCVGGVLPVIKHMPGLGRATVDSHESLPVVKATLDELTETDFQPFQKLSDMPFAMTAHILYTDIDAENCATISRSVIQKIIRQRIGFDGLLISDDVSMKALKDRKPVSARKSLEAGCDLTLECKGVLQEMIEIDAAVPELSVDAQRRWQNAKNWLKPMKLFDGPLALAEFKGLLGAA